MEFWQVESLISKGVEMWTLPLEMRMTEGLPTYSTLAASPLEKKWALHISVR